MVTIAKPKRSRRKPPQFVVDEKGRRTGVLLTLRQYQALLQRIEDLEDIRAAKKALAEEGERFRGRSSSGSCGLGGSPRGVAISPPFGMEIARCMVAITGSAL